ncbi:MAG: RNA methyltransferase [Planctomycetales bacterium]
MGFPANVRFVLVRTKYPGNIGSAARAIKTMGFSQLVLVKPYCDPLDVEAQRLACNAADVLNNAQVFDTLDDALADVRFSVATSQRPRQQNTPYYLASELGQVAIPQAAEHPVAVVFGCETSGLDNDELGRCSATSIIPAETRTPSLNLSQAVMIYAYELHQASLKDGLPTYPWDLAPQAELEQLYEHLGRTITGLQGDERSTMEAYIGKFRRVFGRIPLEQRDVDLLHALLRASDKYVHRFPPTEEKQEQHEIHLEEKRVERPWESS